MSEKFEHSGKIYWITVEPVIIKDTNQTCYLCFVNEGKEPSAFHWGQLLKKGQYPIIFGDTYTALTNAKILIREGI